MNRYEVKIRTPKGNETVTRTVEAVAKNSWSAGCLVLQLLAIESPNLTVTVRPLREAKHV